MTELYLHRYSTVCLNKGSKKKKKKKEKKWGENRLELKFSRATNIPISHLE